MATSSTKPADSHPGFLKFLTRFHKKSTHIDLLRTLMYKTQKKSRSPELTRVSTRGYKLRKSRPPPSDLCKYILNFRKRTILGDPPCPDLQNLKISGPSDHARTATFAQNFRRSPASILRALTRNHNSSRVGNSFTRVHAPSSDKRTQFHDVMDDITPTNRFDWPGNRTRSEPPAKKKKKKRERKCFDLVDLWPWPKSQNFQTGPVPLNFSSAFWIWDPFLHSKLRNCANV